MIIQFPDTGKIPDEFFKAMVYPFCGSDRDEVAMPARYGVDVSIITLPNGFEMALTSDPLSLIPTLGLEESAWLSVHLMANDMATSGKAPMYAQFVLNLPVDLTSEDFSAYWQHIHRYCKEMGTSITGGHTGRFEGQNSTVAGGGTMIAIAPTGEMLTSTGAGPSDVIIVTKQSALVATSILAMSFPETVKNNCGVEVQQQAAALFYETSSLQAGIIAASLNTGGSKITTAMHDVTEGGIVGAIYELALAAGCGVDLDETLFPTGAPQAAVCRLFEIDPHACIGAGAMIIAVKNGEEKRCIDALTGNGIQATVIGSFTRKEDGMRIRQKNTASVLQHPGTDPYWKAFHTAYAKGLK
jgi:hydrogenase expression/formation protein HypE